MAINKDGSSTYFTLPQQQYDQALAIVQNAQVMWQQMVAQFAAENILMGITQAGKTALIADALYTVAVYGSQGSLWKAYDALSKVQITPEMAPFLTADRIQFMRNKMIKLIGDINNLQAK